jgi:hypothetical protein
MKRMILNVFQIPVGFFYWRQFRELSLISMPSEARINLCES